MVQRKIPVTITHSELLKILDQTASPKKRLAWCLGFFACMRVSEVVKLQRQDINTDTRMIHIDQAKGGKDRNIPLPPECIKGIRHLPIDLTPRALQISFKAHAKRVLGKDLKFHTLRHSGATYYLIVKKWDIRLIQMLLGHTRLETTQIYTHVSPQDLLAKMWGDT